MARKILLILEIAVYPIFSQEAEKKAAPAKADVKAPEAKKTLHPEAAKAIEIPGGVLFGEFSKEDGPFLLKGSVIVPSGQSLVFKPGCKIFMGGKYPTITVFGQMTAKGTSDEPVVFQSALYANSSRRFSVYDSPPDDDAMISSSSPSPSRSPLERAVTWKALS